MLAVDAHGRVLGSAARKLPATKEEVAESPAV